MSKALGEEGYETLPVGTPLFMAPEILRRSAYDQSVDIWALGTLSYVLLTSEPPFDAGSLEELKRMIAQNKLNLSPLSVFHDGGEPVKDFIRQALTVNYKNRPTAAELLGHKWLSMMRRQPVIEQAEKYQVLHNMTSFKNANTFQCNVISFLTGFAIEK